MTANQGPLANELLFREAALACLEVKRRQNSPTRIHSVESHCRAFVDMWGSRPLRSITTAEIEDWILARRATVTDGTIGQQLAFLSCIYSQAARTVAGLTNPVASVGITMRLGKRSRWIDAAEEAILQAAYLRTLPAGHLEWTVPRFSILSGCRRLEQACLQPADLVPGKIDPATGGPGPGKLTINRGKTGQRTIPLHPEAVAIALAWIEVSVAEGSPWIFWPEQPSLCIKTRCHHGFGYHTNKWRPALKASGLQDLQWRDLRRTFACRLVEAGVEIFVVQVLLGHSNPRQTMTYTHAQFKTLAAGVMKLY